MLPTILTAVRSSDPLIFPRLEIVKKAHVGSIEIYPVALFPGDFGNDSGVSQLLDNVISRWIGCVEVLHHHIRVRDRKGVKLIEDPQRQG